MDWKRLKTYDFGVLGLFVLIIIGVSLAWHSIAGLDELGDLGGLVGGLGSATGWDFGSVVFAFVLALLAVVVVAVKVFWPAGSALPNWYKEGVAIMGLGGIITLIAVLRVAVAPTGGHEFWNPGPGGFITLVAGLLMIGCGYLMFRDKSGAYEGTAPARAGGYRPVAGGPPPAGGAARFCAGCGAELDSQSRFCKSCGRPI